MIRNLINRQFSKRLIHTAPKLPLQAEFSEQGINGLLSREGFQTGWVDYQKYLTTRLTLLTNGTADETRHPLHITLLSAKDSTRQRVFNVASQTFNNHFFFEQLISPIKNETAPSRSLEAKIFKSFGSLQGLKEAFIAKSEDIQGQGWIFLVEDESKQLSLKALNNSGTPLHYSGNLLLDLNGPVSEEDYVTSLKIKTNIKNSVKDNSLPLLAISLWDHAYFLDYGIEGRKDYVSKAFDSTNWDVINARAF
ncbi:hypothetical protein WICMUC_002289 [Wickerhamomyces mucosus]|uniref:Manganese/iron superoxide dismutase C-terminal domain-containing protein n=1 Tax=Wickerhamomyces mucosus TaxID=1378264 RepID=A0A9P8TDY2_9ASCO|nr:hypothetical protein WICMUC_002289 [Wickerhamomyces mucosus]